MMRFVTSLLMALVATTAVPSATAQGYLTPEEVLLQQLPTTKRAARANADRQETERLTRIYGTTVPTQITPEESPDDGTEPDMAADNASDDDYNGVVIQGASDDVLWMLDGDELHGAAYEPKDDRPPLTGTGPATVVFVAALVMAAGWTLVRARKMNGRR